MPGTAGRAFTMVWASALDDVWLVGSDLYLWRWSSGSLRQVRASSGILWGTSATDVWSGFDHWDGQTWATTGKGDSGYTVTGLWASGPSDAWMVGNDGYVKHWDGIAWTRMTGTGSRMLETVWGTGPTDVWIGGADEQVSRWDGQKWTTLHSLQGGPAVQGFSGVAGDVWILGGKTGAMHWDGTASSPSWIGTYFPFDGIWAGDGLGVFATGGHGILRHAR